jgi:hypothetical protein
MEDEYKSIRAEKIYEKEYNIAENNPILVNINNEHSVYSLPDNVLKKDAVIDQIDLYLTDKNWMAVLKDSTVKITELWMKDTIWRLPMLGNKKDTIITKIVFEVVPDLSILNF